jgi:hypothetical protein
MFLFSMSVFIVLFADKPHELLGVCEQILVEGVSRHSCPARSFIHGGHSMQKKNALPLQLGF